MKVLRQRKSLRWVPELLLIMYCYIGVPYELFVVMYLLKRTLIHQKIFSTVNWIMWKCENFRKAICFRDFNASSSSTWYNLSLRENIIIGNPVVKDNGLRFHEFFNNHCLTVLSTWFSRKKCRRITWHLPDQVTKKIYDFILVCSWLRQYVSNYRVYNSCDFDSNHRLVIADICTTCNKVARFVKPAATSTKSMLTWTT